MKFYANKMMFTKTMFTKILLKKLMFTKILLTKILFTKIMLTKILFMKIMLTKILFTKIMRTKILFTKILLICLHISMSYTHTPPTTTACHIPTDLSYSLLQQHQSTYSGSCWWCRVV